MKKVENTLAIKKGWELFKSNIPVFAVLLLVNIFVYSIPNLTSDLLRNEAPIFSTLITIIFWFLSMLVSLGSVKILLLIVDKKKVDLNYLYSLHPMLLKYIGATFLYGMIVIGGLILLIVPGIILGVKYNFYSYILVDKKLSIMDSFKKSGEITQGIKFQLFLFFIVIGLLNFVGMLFFLIGLIVTIPVTMLAHAYIYRNLLK